MKIIDSYPATTNADLIRCEHEIGRSIPEPYRNFLQKHNGGVPDLACFAYVDMDYGNPIGTYVRAFFGVHERGSETHDSLSYCAETWLNRNRVPHDLFPVAVDGGGNLILLGAEGEKKGKMYFWDHNWEADDGEPPTYRNVHPLADSFEAFLSMLHE